MVAGIVVTFFFAILIYIEGLTDIIIKYELAVGRTGCPIHHAVRLVGRIVEVIHADLLCHHTEHCRVLIFADLTGKQKHQTVSGIIGCMAVGRVNKIGKVTEDLTNRTAEIKSCRNMVCIQKTYRAEQHIAVLTDTAFQPTTDQTTDILQIAALLLGEFRIFLGSLGCTHRVLVTVGDVLPIHLLVLIFLVCSAVTYRNLHFHGVTSLSIVIFFCIRL